MYTKEEKEQLHAEAIAEAQENQKKQEIERTNKTVSDAVQQFVKAHEGEDPLTGRDLGIKK